MKGGSSSYSKYTRPIGGGSGSTAGSGGEDDCVNINIKTILYRTTPALGKIIKGSVLSVNVERSSELSASNNDGVICGYIIHPKMQKVIECIKNGSNFIAIVLNITGTVCEVRVRINK